MAQTPDQIAANWASRLAGSTEKIKQGVQSVQVAPGQAAAAQKAAWVQNTTNAQDKWARNTAAVPLADWQQSMIDKGTARIAQGAQAAQPNFERFMGQLLPAIDSVKRGLPKRGNLEANIARSNAFIRGMAQFQYKK